MSLIHTLPCSTFFPYPTLFRSVQETLLAAWRGLGGFEGRSSLRAWLYRIATNRCLNALRAGTRRPAEGPAYVTEDRKSTRMNSSHTVISYAVFCLKIKKQK